MMMSGTFQSPPTAPRGPPRAPPDSSQSLPGSPGAPPGLDWGQEGIWVDFREVTSSQVACIAASSAFWEGTGRATGGLEVRAGGQDDGGYTNSLKLLEDSFMLCANVAPVLESE